MGSESSQSTGTLVEDYAALAADCERELQALAESSLDAKEVQRQKRELYAKLGHCHYHLDEFESAVDFCTRALLFQPQNVEMLNLRSEANDKLGNLRAALSDMEVALKCCSTEQRDALQTRSEQLRVRVWPENSHSGSIIVPADEPVEGEASGRTFEDEDGELEYGEDLGDEEEEEETEEEKEHASEKEKDPVSSSSSNANSGARNSGPTSSAIYLGCKHYRRRCLIYAPCCNLLCGCRLCHEEQVPDHPIDRTKIIQCGSCHTDQPASNECVQCKIVFAQYYCAKCKLWNDSPNPQIEEDLWHCDGCGLCRKGGRHNFVHCEKCGYCVSVNHVCAKVKSDVSEVCPVCRENLHTSTRRVHFLPCGHLLHSDCFKSMLSSMQLPCPICKKSMIPYPAQLIAMLDLEIAQTPLPPQLQRDVTVLCNDCLQKSTVRFHFVGHKCTHCNSYNTTQLQSDEKQD